jgi:MYXO-CTERM domain-containing protein
MCAIAACHDGYFDLDADPANGCEYACIPGGVETCNDLDDDCDGTPDDGLSCSPGTGSGGTAGNGGGGADTVARKSKDDSGCGCRVDAPAHQSLAWPLLLAAALLARRRRSTRPS